MTPESYYGDRLPCLRQLERELRELAAQYPMREMPDGVQPILYCKTRIKQPDSMIQKLERQGQPTDCASALAHTHDAVGMRIVCSFLDDVYDIARWIGGREDVELLQTKDYIAYPKPNGYRSLHLIVRLTGAGKPALPAEIQLRTIALDFWAALEHQLKYKRDVCHERTIRDELKHCADEIASVDVYMQTLRELLRDDHWD